MQWTILGIFLAGVVIGETRVAGNAIRSPVYAPSAAQAPKILSGVVSAIGCSMLAALLTESVPTSFGRRRFWVLVAVTILTAILAFRL